MCNEKSVNRGLHADIMKDESIIIIVCHHIQIT